MPENLRPTDFPCTRWIVDTKSGNPFPHCTEITGETTRSWLSGTYKYPKSQTRFVSQDEADLLVWGFSHRHRISRFVAEMNGTVLKKIADLIGYTETRCPANCDTSRRKRCMQCDGHGYNYSLRGDE